MRCDATVYLNEDDDQQLSIHALAPRNGREAYYIQVGEPAGILAIHFDSIVTLDRFLDTLEAARKALDPTGGFDGVEIKAGDVNPPVGEPVPDRWDSMMKG